MFISRKGRIPISFQETVERIEKYENFTIVSLDMDILVAADGLETELEMHDKLIVATAIIHNYQGHTDT
jgi:predicted nucleic acid-binding protein